VLDQLFAKLNDEKGIKKVGRGLITWSWKIERFFSFLPLL
jgi:hypothetical protein